MPRTFGASFCLFVACTLVLCASLPAIADDPSLCLVADKGCLAPGGIQVRVILGASDNVVVGGQFTIEFDATALSLIDAAPGRSCDPTSPFAFEVLEDDEHGPGQVRCAFGINFLKGPPPTGVPLTLACLSFAPTGGVANPTSTCLVEGEHPFETKLVDNTGGLVLIDNSQACFTGSPPPVLACATVMPGDNCLCDPDRITDCRGLDTACRSGVCNPTTMHCEVMDINEGGSCDDEDSCTQFDSCFEGVCVGEGCPYPSLCVVSDSCPGLDPTVNVKIRLLGGLRVINGAQFSFQYDPTKLSLVDISPGSACDNSPFVSEIAEIVDEAAGDVFYAVGVGLTGTGTTGAATVACLTFMHLGQAGADVCLFQDTNPYLSLLVDEFGQAVPFGSSDICPSSRLPSGPFCTHFPDCNIPTVSEWGLVAMTLLLLTGAKIRFGFSRAAPRP